MSRPLSERQRQSARKVPYSGDPEYIRETMEAYADEIAVLEAERDELVDDAKSWVVCSRHWDVAWKWDSRTLEDCPVCKLEAERDRLRERVKELELWAFEPEGGDG